MTPTELLRAKLDERGIKWWPDKYYKDTNTCWHANGFEWRASQQKDGKLLIGCTSLEHLTPEQAIAAMVGIEEMYTREECEAQFARGFSLGSLPSGSDPQWDENRQTLDEHMAELGWVRKDAVTVGAGTCHLEESEHEREIPYDLPDCDGGWYTEVTYDCDECGYENIDPNIRFCGGCGRRVVSE